MIYGHIILLLPKTFTDHKTAGGKTQIDHARTHICSYLYVYTCMSICTHIIIEYSPKMSEAIFPLPVHNYVNFKTESLR